MIRLRIKELCKEKGIRYPYTALVRVGISGPTALKYLNGKRKTIVIAHIEKLCHLLRCAPHDLLEWVPDNTMLFDEQHPIQQIKKRKPFNLMDAVKNLSPEEIRKKFE